MGWGGSLGKSILISPPFLVTNNGPERESNSISCLLGSRYRNMTKAVASVAWPQRSTSAVGVNQRMAKRSPSFTTKAVSERLFSIAMSCMVSSGNHFSKGRTAAGFPENTLSAKASIW